MNKIVPSLAVSFVKAEWRVKAELKYAIRELEARLTLSFDKFRHQKNCPEDIVLLCRLLVKKYKKYLEATNGLLEQHQILPWQERVQIALSIKSQLTPAMPYENEKQLIMLMIDHYDQIQSPDSNKSNEQKLNSLEFLLGFNELNLPLGLIALIWTSKTKPMPGWFQGLQNAYESTFEPNQLIDVVMIYLRNNDDLLVFKQEILSLFQELTTADCIEWHRYFSNHDTVDLMHSLYSITTEAPIAWLPELKEPEKYVISTAFHSLYALMETMREVLLQRHIQTNPYHFEQLAQHGDSRRDIRETVFRTLTLYSCLEPLNDNLEHLFQILEESEV